MSFYLKDAEDYVSDFMREPIKTLGWEVRQIGSHVVCNIYFSTQDGLYLWMRTFIDSEPSIGLLINAPN